MSFVHKSVQADMLSDLDIESTESVVLHGGMIPLAATPGIIVGSALVAAAAAGAAVGDAVD